MTAVQTAMVKDIITRLSVCIDVDAKDIYEKLKYLQEEVEACGRHRLFWLRQEILEKEIDRLCKEAQICLNVK